MNTQQNEIIGANKVAQTVLHEANQWRTIASNWHGFFPELYDRFQKILEAVANTDRKSAISANSELFVLLNQLHDAMAKSPFGNLTKIEELERITKSLVHQGEQLEELRQQTQRAQGIQVTDVKVAQDQTVNLTSEIERLKKHLSSAHEALASGSKQLAEEKKAKETAHTRIREAISLFSGIDGTCKQPLPSGPTPPEHLKPLLQKWQQWQAEIVGTIRLHGEQIEDWQSALEEAKAQEIMNVPTNGAISAKGIQKQLETTQSQLNSLLAQQKRGEEIMRRLTRFAEAFETISNSLPNDLMVEPEAIPDAFVPANQDVDLAQEDGLIEQRRHPTMDTLSEIGLLHGLSEKSVFFISLYDLIYDGKRQKKGQFSVLSAADHAGLISHFGWLDAKDFFKDWPWRQDSEKAKHLLLYCGSVVKKAIYMRTDTKLPWDVTLLFPQDKVNAFLADIAKHQKIATEGDR